MAVQRRCHAGLRLYNESMSQEGAPKSAYELAMERLRKKDEAAGIVQAPLTDAQKTEITEIRSLYGARLAQADLQYQTGAAPRSIPRCTKRSMPSTAANASASAPRWTRRSRKRASSVGARGYQVTDETGRCTCTSRSGGQARAGAPTSSRRSCSSTMR
jgi:hypothetical protein